MINSGRQAVDKRKTESQKLDEYQKQFASSTKRIGDAKRQRKRRPITLGLRQGWLDDEAINILALLGFCSSWTSIHGLLVVNLYIYIFIQQRFRQDEL
jgi:hypothetical protein